MSGRDAAGDALPFSPACERNRAPILAILREAFAGRREVLEIGSGTGQHAVFFSAGMPWLRWQATERRESLGGLRARLDAEGGDRLPAPLELDVDQRDWPMPAVATGWDAAFSANTLHIMSAPQVEAFFAGLGAVLQPDARLAIYGPFTYDGAFTSDSNAAFDSMLRARDPDSGLRDVAWIDRLAKARSLRLLADHVMPAHNRLRVWQREA